MVGFFCSTPYQILVAINIKLTQHEDEKVELYILNHFDNAKNVVEKLKDENLFASVNYVDCNNFTKSFSSNKIIRFYEKANAYFHYQRITEKYFDFKNKFYDEVYLTYPDVIIQLAIKILFKQNDKLKINLYEDGTGGYTDFNPSVFKKLFNLIFGFDEVIDKYHSINVFQPELYSGNAQKNNNKINKIPKINAESKKIKCLINDVFNYKNYYDISEKIIFLEQPLDFVDGLNNDLKNIAKEILTKDYIIKLHPRTNVNNYSDFNLYQNNSIPWEVITLNSNLEDKVLISYYSTACVSPKIIFDQEPILIFLYDIQGIEDILTSETKNFIKKFKNLYKDQSKIFIPNTIEELKSIMLKI
jgi:hypothetical protein